MSKLHLNRTIIALYVHVRTRKNLGKKIAVVSSNFRRISALDLDVFFGRWSFYLFFDALYDRFLSRDRVSLRPNAMQGQRLNSIFQKIEIWKEKKKTRYEHCYEYKI